MSQKDGQIFGSKHGYQIPGQAATPNVQLSKTAEAGDITENNEGK